MKWMKCEMKALIELKCKFRGRLNRQNHPQQALLPCPCWSMAGRPRAWPARLTPPGELSKLYEDMCKISFELFVLCLLLLSCVVTDVYKSLWKYCPITRLLWASSGPLGPWRLFCLSQDAMVTSSPNFNLCGSFAHVGCSTAAAPLQTHLLIR